MPVPPSGIGVISPTADPSVLEMCAAQGAVVVVLDCEHAPIGDAEVAAAVRTADACGLQIAARLVAEEVEPRGPRLLDQGLRGVVLARVAGVADLDRVTAALRYPPDGQRGVSASRTNRFGVDDTDATWLARQGDRVWVCVQIEDQAGLAARTSLARHPVTDAVLVGTRDLSLALGWPGQLGAEPVQRAVQDVREACASVGTAFVELLRDGGAVVPGQLNLVGLSALLQAGMKAFVPKGAALNTTTRRYHRTGEIRLRVLRLSTRIVDAANHDRHTGDGVKVGHRTCSSDVLACTAMPQQNRYVSGSVGV